MVDLHPDRPELFIIGMARSGTTFVADLLNDHFDYGMGPEGSFIPQFAKRLKRYGSLSNEHHLGRLIEDISHCEMLEIARRDYPPGERFDVTADKIRGRLRGAAYKDVVRAVLECVAIEQGCSGIASKYPSFWRCPDLLESLFPGSARYVWVVRDGRDAALSLMKEDWGQKSAYAAAKHWIDSMESYRSFRHKVGDRCLLVRYEDVLSDPGRELDRLAAHLAFQLEAGARDAIVEEIAASPMARNFGKWRAQMSPAEVRRFEALAGGWLDEMGYERCFDNPQVALHEHIRYSIGEYARRVKLSLGV